jgi:hypothetical protein
MFSHGWAFQLNRYFVASVDIPPSVYNGNRSPLLSPSLANPIEKWATVSLPVAFVFYPPFPMFSHRWDFQLNHYFVPNIDSSPLVYNGNRSLLLPSPSRESLREVGDGEFACCLCFLPPIPNVFSWVRFSIKLLFCCSSTALPQSTIGIGDRRCHPPHSQIP